MEFSDEQIRDILDLKERITQQIDKQKEEIEILEKNLTTLNSILKNSSFTKASNLKKNVSTPAPQSAIPIKRQADGAIIANVYVTPEKVSIVLENEVGLNAETPPLKTFFVDKIIGEMRKNDTKEVEMGRIRSDSIINCVVNKNGPLLREILITNYRQKERVQEIINTASWSLSRMIENSKKW